MEQSDLASARVSVLIVMTPSGPAFFGGRLAQNPIAPDERVGQNVRAFFDGNALAPLEAHVVTFPTAFQWIVWGGSGGTTYVLSS
jgi:hypothetical protein